MEIVTHHLPTGYLLFLLVPFGLLFIALATLHSFVQNRQNSREERDWSIPDLDDRVDTSLFHGWDVRCKLVTLFLYAFLVASLQNLSLALVAVGISLIALLLARTPLTRVLLRLLAISGFLGMFLVVMPFSAPAHDGDTILIFAGLKSLEFNLRGLLLAATIAAKGIAIALLAEPMLGTAPLPVSLHGLSRLGVPDMAGQMVLLSHRYLHVFSSEAQRMATGMQVRGFRKRTSLATLRAVANFLGMLFVRSFERTERVFDAMRARGWRGHFPETTPRDLRATDLLWSSVWLLSGIVLVVLDRLWL